ncbi:Na+/H+ antiporter subunit E [Micromonospora sp. WMMA1363]|uniref:Na+/H+ antiporter subunit E n=1 Tax=Micromonospora sp. WMMA1363 TaxID=3053985 RepID=UPI00259C773C|nr:Na+/H+ antiporter subunit E [Micromonospora sp. WMMA1363]MDM4723145.1 Na+/H+ antiporter subunit E [Micromonospora sp. WMMA1363]
MTGDPRSADRPRGRVRHWRDQLITCGWLTLVWNLLWGEFSWGNLLGGLLVAAVVLVFFPLPPVTFGGRVRPGALLAFVLRFVAELVTASLHIARIAVQPGYLPRAAILAVRLRVRTDLNLALTAEAVSMVPGTLVLEVDRERGVLYVHVLDVRTPRDLAAGRRQVLTVERRIVRAVGSAAELRQLDQPVEEER